MNEKMKWLYLPWQYKSADLTTKVLNIVLYVMGCSIIIGLLITGYYVAHIHTLNAAVPRAATHRTIREVPVNVDHRRYRYIYHTDVGTYRAAERTVQDVIRTSDHHDMTSSTDRIYWLRKYVSDDELDDDSDPLISHPIAGEHNLIAFDTSHHDIKDLKFVVQGRDANPDDGQSASSIMTGTLDGTTHKITSLSSLDDGQ